MVDAAINAAGARLRRIYEGAPHIATDDPLFELLGDRLRQILGEERAARLLAPV